MEEERVNDQMEQAFGETGAEMEARSEGTAVAREGSADHEAAALSVHEEETGEKTKAKEQEQSADYETAELSEQTEEVALERVPPEEQPGQGNIDPAIYAGWQELARAHPEVVGKPLPDDIMKACVESGLPPLRVYESMMLVKQGEQIEALKQEIATLKQNAEAAQRAPVTAASLGGNDGNDPNDAFLREFNS